jgi:glycosyltransferase involved in cell wall biosynthesis
VHSKGKATNVITLSIVIPTYSRPSELTRCLQSVRSEVDSVEVEARENLEIVIGDNCSPIPVDNIVLGSNINCNLKYIRRLKNIGSHANIINLSKAADGKYFLWLTDDDFLVSGALKPLLNVLTTLPEHVGFIWTSLPTFDSRTNKIFTVASQSFQRSTFVKAGRLGAATYGNVGWALSRQIYRKAAVNLEDAQGINNAYWTAYLATKVMADYDSFYYDRPYIMHSYYNQEHWEEWGIDLLDRKLKIFCDYCKVFDQALMPMAHEHAVLEVLKQRRVDYYLGHRRNEHFIQILARDGRQLVEHKIKLLLEQYPMICNEAIQYLFTPE